MTRDDALLLEFLLDVGMLSRSQVAALEKQSLQTGESFYHTLVESNYLPEDDVRRALSRSLSIPFVTPDPSAVSDDILLLLPEAFCRAHSLVAYKEEGGKLALVALDLEAKEEVEALQLPYTIVAHLTDRQTIKRLLLRYQQLLKERHAGHMGELSKAILVAASPEDLRASAEQPAVQHMVDMLFEHALSQSASDIHLEPRESGLMVRYRIGGRLYDAVQLPLHTAASVLARIQLLAKLDLASLSPQEGRFKIILQNKTPERVTLRVATMPDSGVGKMVVCLAREREGRSGFMLESLGFHGRGLDTVHRMLMEKSGLLLVCGPEGSGITTLLYTLLDHSLDSTRSVVTVENPIEMRIPGAVQTQVDVERGIFTAARVSAALKVDPDVVMVSQCPDQETANILLRAANEGRFILTSVLSRTSAEVLDTLRDMVSAKLLASVLVGVVSTHLARRLCKEHEATKLSREELNELEARGARMSKILETLKEEGRIEPTAQWKDLVFGRAKPCEKCDDGYQGFVGVQELVPLSRALKDVLMNSSSEDVEETIREDGHLSLLEDALYKAALGLTSVEEVFGLGV